MKLAFALSLVSIVGCGKSSNRVGDDDGSAREGKKKEPAANVAASPECLAKTKALAPWFAALALEAKSYEVDFGYVLATVPRGPSPVTHTGDAVEITAKRISSWDSSEHNHIDSAMGDKPDDAKLLSVLKDTRAKLSPADGSDHADDTQLRVDIDKAAPWGSVVRVMKAAKDAGYAKVVFAVTATSEVVAPAGVDPWTQSSKETDAAEKKIEEMGTKCPAVKYAELDKLAAGLEKCNCAVEPDELAKQVFIDKRWHQAVPRTSVTVLLGDGKTISKAYPTPWSDAVVDLLAEATAGGPPPTLSFELAKR